MRPRQWPKNAFVFVALFFDEKLLVPTYLWHTAVAFLLLCLMSSAVYIMNDLSDIENDRQHPIKRLRPLASGQLHVGVAKVCTAVFALGSLALGYWLSPLFALILLTYFLSQIAYTYWLKNVVLLDVMVVTLGFVLRIAAGVAVIEVERFSPWLYLFGGFLALFLVLGKRRHELILLGDTAVNHRKILAHYNLDLIDRMLNLVTSGVLLFYSLYTFLAEGLPDNHTMMLTIPFLAYGIFRYMYLVYVRHEGGAPEEIALRDRPLQATIVCFALTVFIVIYLF